MKQLTLYTAYGWPLTWMHLMQQADNEEGRVQSVAMMESLGRTCIYSLRKPGLGIK